MGFDIESCRGDGRNRFIYFVYMSTATLDLARDTASATIRPCAKINLSLECLRKREDGFHELRSVAIGVDLTDTLTARSSSKPETVIQCSDSSILEDENLVMQASRLIDRKYGPAQGFSSSLEFGLEKGIPVGAGLGGGSSDAAGALRLLNCLRNLNLSPDCLAELGSILGSDVALFFQLPAVLMSGRGEIVQPLQLAWSGWVLLVFAGPAVSTAKVYNAFESTCVDRRASDVEAICSASSADEMATYLFNDLEPAVFEVAPYMFEMTRSLHRLEFGPFRVSGAGSTLYQLFDTNEAASHAAKEIEDCGLGVATAVVAAPIAQSSIED